MLKFALPPTPTPDASQWNIGGVGSSGVGAGVGHFMLFMSIHLRRAPNANPFFGGIWALKFSCIYIYIFFNFASGGEGHCATSQKESFFIYTPRVPILKKERFLVKKEPSRELTI